MKQGRTALGAVLAVAALGIAGATAQADPPSRAALGQVAAARWDGGATTLGSGDTDLGATILAGAGDVNGDGSNDILASTGYYDSSWSLAYDVLFTRAGGDRNVQDLPAKDGYRVRVGDFSFQTVDLAIGIGDQNGDGVPDQVVKAQNGDLTVVYGVRDPSTLPLCPDATQMHCLDLSTLTPGQGYTIVGGADASGAFGTSVLDAGDTNGDGIDDIAIMDPAFQTDRGRVSVVYGGRASTGSPVDVSALPASQALSIVGGAGSKIAFAPGSAVGDVNRDGRADLALYDQGTGSYRVLYSPAGGTGTVDLTSFGPALGYTLASAPAVFRSSFARIGDVNGDGRDDFAQVVSHSIIGDLGAGLVSIQYAPATAPTAAIPYKTIPAAQGYNLSGGPAGGSDLATYVGPAGDLNGDGVADMVFGDPDLQIGGVPVGGIHLVYGDRPSPAQTVDLGASLTSDRGIALFGPAGSSGAGAHVVPADVDDDGITDYIVGAAGATEDGVPGSGSIYVVLGSDLVADAVTAPATGTSQTGTTLTGVARANGRPVTARFQYGTTTAYDHLTAVQTLGHRHASESVEAPVAALAPAKTYHYRLVVKNDLGLTRYGRDRTFTTAAVPGGPTIVHDQTPAEAIDVTLGGVPNACVKRGKSVKLRVTTKVAHATLGGVTLSLKGKTLKKLAPGTTRYTISSRKLTKSGTYRVRAVATTKSGNARAADADVFTVCAKKATKTKKKTHKHR
jgi:hypothetical protein